MNDGKIKKEKTENTKTFCKRYLSRKKKIKAENDKRKTRIKK